MDAVRVSEILILMLFPTLAVVAMMHVPRAVRKARRLVAERSPDSDLQPTRPPIEVIAADLQRLLQRHEATRRSPGVAMRARHLRALEGAITDCATQATLALGLPCPDLPPNGMLATPELRRLLQALAGAGLVLPPAIGLLAA
jgi:hypothetical protein